MFYHRKASFYKLDVHSVLSKAIKPVHMKNKVRYWLDIDFELKTII